MLISPEYAALNREHHGRTPGFGAWAGNAAHLVRVCEQLGTRDVLDYGAGKGALARSMPWPIQEYDPAIPGKQRRPRPADIVICHDVLEHVEPACLDDVLTDLARCVKRLGLFSTVSAPSFDVLPDGRNAHLIQHEWAWWEPRLAAYFSIDGIQQWRQIIQQREQMFIGSTAMFIAVSPRKR